MAYNKKKKKEPKKTEVVADDEHSKLIQWVNEADDATTQTRELAEKSRLYYDSVQWTGAEIAKLKAQKQAPTVINRIKPKIDSLMGMERANRTTAKAWPRTPKHTEGATAATEAVRFVLHDNFFERKRSDAWENMLIEGTGGLDITVKANDDDTYKVVITHIMWDRIIYDPHSRRKDFSDAKYLGQVVWMDYDDAVAMYPDAKDVLESMQSGSETYDDKPRWMDNTRRRVKIVELYYRKEDGDWWYACFTYGGYCKSPMKSPYVNEEGETEHCYEFASLFVDREGCRYGAERQLLDIQDEINKRRSKALHLLSVRQTFGTKGAVEDVNKARAELAKPDGHVEFAYGELNKDFGVLPTGDMAAAQFNLLTEAKMEMDSVGANSATMGKDKTVQSGIALRQRALTGQTELAPMFDMLKNLDIRVYRKVWNRIKQYWKAEMWLRVTDDENNLKFVGLNKPMTKGDVMLKQAQAQGAPPEALQQLAQQIQSDPLMQEVVSTENDIVNLDVDIVMDDAPDTVTQEVEDFQAMAEMVKSGFPLPPEAVIMASPLSNKDKIIKMMKEQPKKLPPEVEKKFEEQAETIKKQSEEIQALKQDQQAEQAKLQLSAQQAQAELALQKAKQEGEAALARAKAEADFALEKYKVEQQLILDQMKCDNDKKIAAEKVQVEGKIARDKLNFEQKVKAEEMLPDDVKASLYEQTMEESAVMPKFVEALGQIAATFTKALETQQQALTEVVKAVNQPKRVTLGGVQRNMDGQLTGASATVN